MASLKSCCSSLKWVWQTESTCFARRSWINFWAENSLVQVTCFYATSDKVSLNIPRAPDSNPTKSSGSKLLPEMCRHDTAPSTGMISFCRTLPVGFLFPKSVFYWSRPAVGKASISCEASTLEQVSSSSQTFGMWGHSWFVVTTQMCGVESAA